MEILVQEKVLIDIWKKKSMYSKELYSSVLTDVIKSGLKQG